MHLSLLPHFLIAAWSAALAPPPLVATPASPWKIGQRFETCVGMRDFTAGGRNYTVTLQPDMVGPGYRIGYIDEKAALMIGEAEVEVAAPGSFSFRDTGNLSPSSDPPGLAMVVVVPRTAVMTIAAAARITISGRGRAMTFATPDLRPIVTALQQCKLRQIDAWGIDRARVEAMDVGPKVDGNILSVFGSKSYPHGARRRGEQGRVVMLLTISPAGQVTDCRPLASSGSSELDNDSCELARTRARYAPALSKRGEKIEGLTLLPINWTLGF